MRQQIYEAITNLPDDLIEEAYFTRLTKRKIQWKPYLGVVALLVLVLGLGKGLLPLSGGLVDGSSSSSSSSGSDGTTGSSSTGSVTEGDNYGYTGTTTDTTTNLAQVYTSDQVEQMQVVLIAWQSEGFRAVVVDTGNTELFPLDAELTVILEVETEIVLSDGTLFSYTPDSPNAEVIDWEIGTEVSVSFQNYEQYQADNHFYNRVYACQIDITNQVNPSN